MQGIEFPVGRGDDNNFGVKATENGMLNPGKSSGVDVFYRFQKNGRIDGALGPITVLE
jgi:hypothetical protein